jgi:hypothetical protein
MFRRLGTTLVCLAMFFIAGGHWAVLQSVAWAGMLNDYAQTDGIVTAVQKTFSGDYPCAMCRKIDTAQKQQEQQAPLAKLDKKFETFVAQSGSTRLFPPSPDSLLAVPRAIPPAAPAFAPPQPIPIAA